MKTDSKAKLATKIFVLDEVSKVDTSVHTLSATVDKNKESLDAKIKEYKADNIREHMDIKTEFQNTAKNIDDKLNIVIGFINSPQKTGT